MLLTCSTRHDLYKGSLTRQAQELIGIPQSQWTTELLEDLAMDPTMLSDEDRRGCYLLVAINHEDGDVELYLGSSDDMLKRFEKHIWSISRITPIPTRIQYFHRRCRKLNVSKPLFIPMSYEVTGDNLALLFQESGHIAINGTWEIKNAPARRIKTWEDVKEMKWPCEDEVLPPGWSGANCEIPFVVFIVILGS